MNKPKPVPPKFDTEAEERAFWEIHDSSDYVDWKQAMPVSFPNLKPSTNFQFSSWTSGLATS